MPPSLMPRSLIQVGWLFSKIRVLPGLVWCATGYTLNLGQSWSSALVGSKSDSDRRKKSQTKHLSLLICHLYAAEMKGLLRC